MFLTFCEIRNVAEIERRHLEAYLAHARGEGQGDKSVRDKYIIIAAWLKWAKAQG
jgi:type II secretory pathway component PulL